MALQQGACAAGVVVCVLGAVSLMSTFLIALGAGVEFLASVDGIVSVLWSLLLLATVVSTLLAAKHRNRTLLLVTATCLAGWGDAQESRMPPRAMQAAAMTTAVNVAVHQSHFAHSRSHSRHRDGGADG